MKYFFIFLLASISLSISAQTVKQIPDSLTHSTGNLKIQILASGSLDSITDTSRVILLCCDTSAKYTMNPFWQFGHMVITSTYFPNDIVGYKVEYLDERKKALDKRIVVLIVR